MTEPFNKECKHDGDIHGGLYEGIHKAWCDLCGKQVIPSVQPLDSPTPEKEEHVNGGDCQHCKDGTKKIVEASKNATKNPPPLGVYAKANPPNPEKESRGLIGDELAGVEIYKPGEPLLSSPSKWEEEELLKNLHASFLRRMISPRSGIADPDRAWEFITEYFIPRTLLEAREKLAKEEGRQSKWLCGKCEDPTIPEHFRTCPKKDWGLREKEARADERQKTIAEIKAKIESATNKNNSLDLNAGLTHAINLIETFTHDEERVKELE